MKKKLGLLLMIGLIIGIGTGCMKKIENDKEKGVENPRMQAVIYEISESEILVETIDYEGFDKARVNLQGFSLDFTPEVGQTLDLTILPQVGMSYPAFINPVEIKLVK